MGKRVEPGDQLPFFEYDTPFSGQNSFRDLLAQSAPLVLVFMSNFGHPVTRTFIGRYAQSYPALQSGGMALVVRSRPDKLAASMPRDSLPYTVLCDAEGVLYEYLAIPQKTGNLAACSLEAWGILRRAKKQGYRPQRDAAQQLPLTLVLDADGTVLFCHYGASLTDVPADCAAMEKLLCALAEREPPDRAEPEPEEEDAETEALGDALYQEYLADRDREERGALPR